MSDAAHNRAMKIYRARLTARGLSRFEVTALESDREMIRAIAHRLAEDGPQAEQARAAMKTVIAGEPPKTGGILAALRRSPLVGEDLDLCRK
jgi:hypothetical protein